MSPKGVEHEPRIRRTLVREVECIHQCRRKALSTPDPIHSGRLRAVRECIHQCRRKALSTTVAVWWQTTIQSASVHSSMSPKGVEHTIQGVRSEGPTSTGRAFINVAERR